MKTARFDWMMVLLISLALTACGADRTGSGNTAGSQGIGVGHTVGGAISALNSSNLVLQNNDDDAIAVSGNSSSFTFRKELVDGDGYNVTVKTQPASQFCTVTQGSGTISGANIVNIDVDCFGHFTIK